MIEPIWFVIVFIVAVLGFFFGKASQHLEAIPYMFLLREAGYILNGDLEPLENVDLLDEWIDEYKKVLAQGKKRVGFNEDFAIGLSLLKDKLERAVKARLVAEIKNQRDSLRFEDLTLEEVRTRVEKLSRYLQAARMDWAQVSPDPNWYNFVEDCYARAKSRVENTPSR